MKRIAIFILIICIVILSGCNILKPVEPETPQLERPDLSTEQSVTEYLVGEWFGKNEYMSNTAVYMKINESLDVQLLFYDSLANKTKGEYIGKIKLHRMYSSLNEAPDMITIELDDTDYSVGDFFFRHRTIYDGKRVMSFFFTGSGNSVFNILAGDINHGYVIEEIILEKETGEESLEKPRKNDDFYAVFWGHGVKNESIWLDDVQWTPPSEDELSSLYSPTMTVYENDVKSSILYSVNYNKRFEILGDDIFKGEVYHVKTDEQGNIIEFINAQYKEFLEQGEKEYDESEIRNLIFDIVTNDIEEVQEYINNGMSILYTGETIIIDDEQCYYVFLGTNHEENFVREIHYAVNIYTRKTYKYDIINDNWEIIKTD